MATSNRKQNRKGAVEGRSPSVASLEPPPPSPGQPVRLRDPLTAPRARRRRERRRVASNDAARASRVSVATGGGREATEKDANYTSSIPQQNWPAENCYRHYPGHGPLQRRAMIWQPIPPLLLPLFLVRLALPQTACQFQIVVNRFDALGGDRELFFKQEILQNQHEIFKELLDSPIDTEDRNAHYLGFPYYLKVNLSCAGQDSARAIRKAHYTGLIPIVAVAFEEPVHTVRQKPEQLQISMKAAPYRISGNCDSELCQMCWYTPMPIMNGSVVMAVTVKSNNLGFLVNTKRAFVNINGYVKETNSGHEFSIGEQLTSLKDYVSLRDESRPLWHTFKQAPVLILGGFPKHKMVIISDTGFDDFFPIEVAIDSCWISSPKCPWEEFSSSIFDAIATESTLFIRQNQLIYYFTGNYTALYMNTSGSELWTRILTKHCVRKLNPVAFPKNNTEFVIALGGGSQEGKFFLITVSDGIVKHAASSKKSACSVLGTPCELMWTVFDTESNKFFLLIHTKLEGNVSSYYIMAYYRAKDQGFVVMIGQEQYTDIPMVPRGISYNPFSLIFYIWGNMILQSNDLKNYLYLSNFRSDSSIKYFVQSYMGPYACVTDDEQVWISHEGSSIIRKIYPTRAYTMYRSLQLMSGSKRFGLQESLVSLFYEKFQLRELVYIEDALGNGKLFKRATPLRYILTYNHIIENPQRLYPYNGKDYIKFSHTCPFGRVNIVELPPPQRYTREEYYRTEPPDIMEKTGFHDKKSLTVYQGLIFQLLWLHSAYNRPYADPVHDPTWRWWKNKAENMQYYSYVASNRNSSGGIYVNMNNYVKVYRVKASNLLPDTIYLDKNSAYNFSVFFNIRTKRESLGETPEENSLNLVWLTLIVTHPEYLNVLLDRRELISRGSVIYKVTVMDAGVYPRQDLSGKKLLQTSMIFSVRSSGQQCYGYIDNGPVVKGYRVLPVVVGCPPGRRLAFDITGTLQYTTRKNKHYFDCVNPDPEMPCFFFNDVFYPLFLIQDMVTGDSGPFQGSYIFKIIGGGPYSTENIRYFSEEEILLYNTNNNSEVTGHIWLREDTTDTIMNDEGFHILSGTDSGILWVCQERSPCYDILPRDMLAPDYFFVVKVTNRGVDQTTYCDYALEFIIHVHGLRLSPTRAIFLMKVSMGSVAGLVVLYMVAYVLGPKVRSVCSRVARRIEEVVILRTGSSITFSSSATSRSSHNFPNLSDVSTIASFPSHTYAHAHAQGK
ncbi:cation channel sperm-associated auxiliary subunit gamma-like [Eublepharis macularius]|uniref:Cation channel sperm-associated auxiliary subunit gamma-like n=1 Tax=Eublepharis macularius TaxID=481883 RepID=A0AA97LG79_EUBMA|nr:cation channel sperm-associated auxiliary subunit gamma-like [Eublepharis macularius]